MKMSKENYDLFTRFYNLTVERATDEEVKYCLCALENAILAKRNENMSDYNKKTIRDFFEDFLINANDDDAIYLLEVLKAACDKISKSPKEIEKFVTRKKKDGKKN